MASGVKADFADFYRGEYPQVYRAVYFVTSDPHAAFDLTQEAFARAYARWRRLSREEWSGGWVTTTALNLAKRSRIHSADTDELRSGFSRAGEDVVIPPGDLDTVVGRGRARRRRRIAWHLASVTVVLAVVGGAVAILGGQEDRPLPTSPVDVDRLSTRLVPEKVDGPPPSSGLASDEARADARAVTVAFHAFLEGSSRGYLFDYEGFVRDGDAWRVRFVQFPPPTALEKRLSDLEIEMTTTAERLRAQRFELLQSVRRLSEELKDAGRGESRDARRRLAALRRQRPRMKEEIRPLERRIDEVEARQRTAAARRPSYTTVLTVVERDEAVSVERVDTDSPDAASLRRILGYAEPAAQVDAWGNDYFDAVFRPNRARGGGVRVEVRSFWTGPLSSAYEEACRHQVVAGDEGVVATEPRRKLPPGVDALYEVAPSTEDGRDGATITFGVDYDGDAGNLSLRMLCEWRPRR